VEVFIQEEEEVPDEQNGSNKHSEDTDRDGTTLNWEATAARKLLDKFGGANANAAAAWFFDSWGPWIIILFLLFFFRFLA